MTPHDTTTTTGPHGSATSSRPTGSGLSRLASASWIEATRHLRVIPRNPDLLMFATLQPVMFVVLFNYVFGGAIDTPGFRYEQYLLPGIFAQSVVFGSGFTGIGLAEDMTKGLIDRLRSLPIPRTSVLVGRTLSDLARNAITFTVMLGVAFLIGFRFEGGLAKGTLATALLLSFAYAFSWIQALIGLSVSSVEAANSAGFIWMFPMTFVSSAFVPTDTMPSWLERIATANPFTIATNAARALYSGTDPGSSVWTSFAWVLGITAVFATLSIRKFTRMER